MKKKIFLVGKVYDLAKVTALEIIGDVQSRLDTHYGKDKIVFNLCVCEKEKEVTINFRRSYKEWYHPEETTNIFCADMDLITGRGVDDFEVPCMWPTAPLGYPFSTGIDEFITCYKNSAKAIGASRMKDIMIEHNKDVLNMRLFY